MATIIRTLTCLFEDKERVTFYPTFGYREGKDWYIPLRVWVHEPRRLVEAVVCQLADIIGNRKEHEQKNFETRLAHIVADSESREKVIFKFDNDPEEEEFRVQTEDGCYPRSDLNGIIKGFVRISDARAHSLMKAQKAQMGWLTFRAISDEHSGIGRVRLVEREGLSVISDIDDTLKVTEIPAGGNIVAVNTFFRDFTVAPEMVDRYKEVGQASFHYVSGAPWQLFQPLSDFLVEKGFPEGSFHMKSVPSNLLSPTTWHDLLKLTGDATEEQKLSQISEIMTRFPLRKFILVGDSGEHDPEIYQQLQEKFGDQIVEIVIRDVINSRNNTPERLAGMSIIPARTVVDGASEFG
ncbi:MAG: phosphatidate phosphatase App1 family protein [Desulforhopalus sp.]